MKRIVRNNIRKTDALEKSAMAGKTNTLRSGNYNCGAPKFRLTDITSTPLINSIADGINDRYSGDGGSLYFLFTAENSYSSPMEVNDHATLDRMKKELKSREVFIKSVTRGVFKDRELKDKNGNPIMDDPKPLLENGKPVLNNGEPVMAEPKPKIKKADDAMKEHAFYAIAKRIVDKPKSNGARKDGSADERKSEIIELYSKFMNKYSQQSIHEIINDLDNPENDDNLLADGIDVSRMLKSYAENDFNGNPSAIAPSRFLFNTKSLQKLSDHADSSQELDGVFSDFYNGTILDTQSLSAIMFTKNMERSQREKLTEELITDRISKESNKKGFSAEKFSRENVAKLVGREVERRIDAEREQRRQFIKSTFIKFQSSASDHPEVSGRGEINLLKDSIEKIESSMKDDNPYDINSFITSKINEINITDPHYAGLLSDTYSKIQRIGFNLQMPSWFEISFPRKGIPKRSVGGRHGDNLKEDIKIENLSFRTDKTHLTSERNPPSTPMSAIVNNIGYSQKGALMLKEKLISSIARHLNGNEESLRHLSIEELLNHDGLPPTDRAVIESEDLLNPFSKSVRQKYLPELVRYEILKGSHGNLTEQEEKRINGLKEVSRILEGIRSNINDGSTPHNSKESFFHLYDELCHFYGEYHRSRYGDAIFIENSAVGDRQYGTKELDSLQVKLHLPSASDSANQNVEKNPFAPANKADELRDIIISVTYAYSDEKIPLQLATTNLPKDNFRFKSMPSDEVKRVKDKMLELGVSEVMIDGQERPIDKSGIDDFFDSISSPGSYLVYRIKKDGKIIEDGESGEFANLKWFVGSRSFRNRFDETRTSSRTVFDDNAAPSITYEGKGYPRIHHSENLDRKVDSLERALDYAKSAFGLDLSPAVREKIESSVAKSIKPIPFDFIRANNDGVSEIPAEESLRKIITEDKKTVITEDTVAKIDESIRLLNERVIPQGQEEELTSNEKIEEPESDGIYPPLNALPTAPQEAVAENSIQELSKIYEDNFGLPQESASESARTEVLELIKNKPVEKHQQILDDLILKRKSLIAHEPIGDPAQLSN